jgi:glutamate formiminotransferase / 5-formyltetrahydrofolate cyclo-ligase
MPLIAVPNVSEGRDGVRIQKMVDALSAAEASVLDVHSDPIHHRSVLTLTAASARLPAVLAQLALQTIDIDLTSHTGVHPRLGGLDVCPIVPHDVPMRQAVLTAHAAGASIHSSTGLPVYFYGEAARRPETRELPDIRRGGLQRLMHRAGAELPPDLGIEIDPRRGVVCVGARDVLIAFNVYVRTDMPTTRSIAASVRASNGGLSGVRALALPIARDVCQVSLNLTRPQLTGIDTAFAAIAELAGASGVEVMGTEIVGLVPQRYLPDPEKQAARLLTQPDRCLEAKLQI